MRLNSKYLDSKVDIFFLCLFSFLSLFLIVSYFVQEIFFIGLFIAFAELLTLIPYTLFYIASNWGSFKKGYTILILMNFTVIVSVMVLGMKAIYDSY
ncbi:MAG: hypothetical protein KDC42_04690 [Ignavibacteriae bacterium]|nr:hypothetical protein [Ignavibacteriota bacterium]